MNKPAVVITGALTGIGRATALAFAKNGARLVVSGRRETEGKALEQELQALGAEAVFVQADVRRDDEVRRLIDQAVARFGRLDVAVNNAGTEGQPGPIVNQTAESYAATFDTNVLGTLLSVKHELRVMSAQKSGSIINISSTYGHAGCGVRFGLRGQQARGRGPHQVGRAGSRRERRSGQCGSARAHRDRNARSLHGNPGEQGRAGLDSATRPSRQTRGHRPDDRVPGVGRRLLCDRRDRLRRRRQIRRLMPSAAIDIRQETRSQE